MQTIQQNRKVYSRPQRPERRSKRKTAPAKKCPRRTPAPDFLRHPFNHLLCRDRVEASQQEIEEHFYASLRHLESHYNMKPARPSVKPYPLNILDAFQRVRDLVNEDSHLEKVFLVENGRYPYCLATAKLWDTGYHLYHIPLQALMRLMRKPERKPETSLFLSAFCYLAEIARIPSYAKEDAIAGIHESTKNYLTEVQEEYEEMGYQETDRQRQARALHYQSFCAEYNIAEYFGTKMQEKISHPYHLEAWAQRMDRYRPKDDQGKALLEASRQLFELYRRYPLRKCYDQFFSAHFFHQDDMVTPYDEYLSFVWTTEGVFGEEVYEYINGRNEQFYAMQEPLEFTLFDTEGGRPAGNLGYEEKLFPLIDSLVDLLIQFQS